MGEESHSSSLPTPSPGILTRVSFTLALAADVVEADAGATTPVGLTVVNRGAAADRYEVEVEGIDPEWRFVPVPAFSVEPGESRGEKIFLKPPRLPESVAGSYPFVVRVRSLESGEARTAQGLLKLAPFHHVTMEITPKKGVVSPTTKRNDFRLSVANLGNSEHTLQLSAQDPDERCAYEFEQDTVTLAPGQGREVEMVARPKQTPLFSGGRLIGFSAFARSQADRAVTATAQAQLEQRSLFSPATLVAAALIAAALGGWWKMRPQPPTVALSVNPPHALAGTAVQVTIETHNADHVVVRMGGELVYEGTPTDKPQTAVLKGTDEAVFTAVVTHEGRETAHDEKYVRIDPLVVAPPAKIGKFWTDAKRVKLGSSFIAHWDGVENATKIAIEPLPTAVDLNGKRLEITPNATGEQTYTLVATNADGKATRKDIKVDVYDESDAAIQDFSVNPTTAKEADGGKVTLTWNVTNAAYVQLKVGSNELLTVESAGTRDVVITGKTVCVLTALDAKNRKVVKQLKVLYEKAPPPPVEPPTTTGTTAGGPPTDPNFPDKIPPPVTTGGATAGGGTTTGP